MWAGEFGVEIDAQCLVNRGNDFFRGNGALCRIAADVIAFANDLTAFDAAANRERSPGKAKAVPMRKPQAPAMTIA